MIHLIRAGFSAPAPIPAERPAPSVPRALAALCALVGLACAPVVAAPSTLPDDTLWVTNAPVDAIARADSLLYLAGEFTYIGPNTGGGAPLDAATGEPIAGFARVNGRVFAAEADGVGGWFLGGDFTQVGRTPRRNLVHILADGRADPAWSADTDGFVLALSVSRSTLYVGGSFQQIGGVVRRRVAELDVKTGAPTPWLADTDGTVRALTVAEEHVFLGGDFTRVHALPRRGLARVSAADGAVADWDPTGPNTSVRSLALVGGTLYVGGKFSAMGGLPRDGLAAIDAQLGTLMPWNPNLGSTLVLAVAAGTVYAGDDRGGLHAINSATGAAYELFHTGTWVDGFYDEPPSIRAIAVSGTRLFVGGTMRPNSYQDEDRIVVLDLSGGGVAPVEIPTNGTVYALEASGAHVFAGGALSSIGGIWRSDFAALDLSTGLPTSWSSPPAPGGYPGVSALLVAEEEVFVGGNFLYSIDAATGEPTGWSAGISPSLNTMMADESRLYVAGGFTMVNGAPRRGLAVFDRDTGALIESFGAPDGIVDHFALSGGTLYTCGNFTSVAGGTIERPRLAAFDVATGALTPWNPAADNRVDSIALLDGTLYAAGDFNLIGGVARQGFAAIDPSTGALCAWNPGPCSGIGAMRVLDGVLLLIGSNITIDEINHGGTALFDPARMKVIEWGPRFELVLFAYMQSPLTNPAGGDSSATAAVALAALSEAIDDPDTRRGDTPEGDPQAVARHTLSIQAFLPDDTGFCVAGYFSRIEGAPHYCLARFNPVVTPTALAVR